MITLPDLATSVLAAATSGDTPRDGGWQASRNIDHMTPTHFIRELERLAGDRRGTAFAEYLAAVGAFGLVVGAIMTTRAQSLVVDYASARDLLMLPAM